MVAAAEATAGAVESEAVTRAPAGAVELVAETGERGPMEAATGAIEAIDAEGEIFLFLRKFGFDLYMHGFLFWEKICIYR